MRAGRHFPQFRRAGDCGAAGNFLPALARAEPGSPTDRKEAQPNREEPRQDLLGRDVRLVACLDSAGPDSDDRDWDGQGAAGRGLADREAFRLLELAATNAMRAATQEFSERLHRLCAHLRGACRHCRASARGSVARVDVALPWPAQRADGPSRESAPARRKSRDTLRRANWPRSKATQHLPGSHSGRVALYDPS